MHPLLKRQLKKIAYKDASLSEEQAKRFITLVDQAYHESDEDRTLLENTLTTSSEEMRNLYQQLEEASHSKLAKSEEKYRRLVENLQHHYFFYTYDKEGKITYVSESATKMLGYSQEELLTDHLKFLTDDPINKKIKLYTNNAFHGISQPPYEVSIYHKDGSTHYLEITELPFINDQGEVEGLECIARDITMQREAQEKVMHLANHDMLTGIANRLYLDEQLQMLIADSKRQHNQFAMLFLDLDHFKQINDTLGHDIGDVLLQEVAKRIKNSIRKEDLFARIGGDEFILVLTRINVKDLSIMMHKLTALMHQPWHVEGYELNVSASIGIAIYPQDGTTSIELMKNADMAMYRTKELGRDNFSFFADEFDQHVHLEMQLEQDMSNALNEKQFELYYQPKLSLKDNKVFGAEILIRWNHPTMGIITPDKFIPLAESTGFILKLGRWILEETCLAIARFNCMFSQKLSLSVNVSIRQFQQRDFCNIIQSALEKSKVPPEQLAIEITESVMMKNTESMIEKIKSIKAMGVKIYMDDFGTGYSSLSYLHHLPIDVIKIDRTFVNEISKNGTEKAVILDTIVSMGKSLGKVVLAEGVEEEYQRQYLLGQGCDLYQGFYFSKPLQESAYISLIASAEYH